MPRVALLLQTMLLETNLSGKTDQVLQTPAAILLQSHCKCTAGPSHIRRRLAVPGGFPVATGNTTAIAGSACSAGAAVRSAGAAAAAAAGAGHLIDPAAGVPWPIISPAGTALCRICAVLRPRQQLLLLGGITCAMYRNSSNMPISHTCSLLPASLALVYSSGAADAPQRLALKSTYGRCCMQFDSLQFCSPAVTPHSEHCICVLTAACAPMWWCPSDSKLRSKQSLSAGPFKCT